MELHPSRTPRRGFLLFEVLLALALFGIMAVSFTETLAGLRRNSDAVQTQMEISHILHNHLQEVLTVPRLEEGEHIKDVEASVPMQIITRIEPLELENEDGTLLSNMMRIVVTAAWTENNENVEESIEGWRNLRLYQR